MQKGAEVNGKDIDPGEVCDGQVHTSSLDHQAYWLMPLQFGKRPLGIGQPDVEVPQKLDEHYDHRGRSDILPLRPEQRPAIERGEKYELH
jgi:hypothetical protein